ncbi:adenine-specific DNA-methyltransferase [Lampropedia hyalina DSM 16112]|jgi:adenine-specific DNA-methyltransferase|uniref:site-specific DNA-methyltransferase (adenine-specific) n=1 Tax=Lampropedia hyalina DSM 16112 TaxID=1122156 RepID=A0A1M5CZ19_9BURK|nr:DNA methyltransferase [Lampropedia hyalina]SHF59752.1 adenine-specific DNA-methyltransferase [Lampropedia hyalina DSM 16112]
MTTSKHPFFTAPSPAAQKLELLRELFPAAVQTEADGHIRVNAAAIQQALDPANPAGIRVEEDGYELRWVGKREAYHTAFVPPQKIVQPLPADSTNWDTTGNLLIKGDNLDALKLLRQSYFGAVKLIYIDPPYNTQSDAFIYRDDFSVKQSEVLAELGHKAEDVEYIQNIYGARTHSGWLSFMYPRLLLAKDLLRDDGVIFISIDDNEQAQLKLLCDEVFGQENFVASIVWKKRSSPDQRDTIGAVHDWILCYTKDSTKIKEAIGKIPLSQERIEAFSNPDHDPRGPWASVDMTGMTGRATKDQYFSVTLPSGRKITPPPGRSWGLIETTFLELKADNRIWFGFSGDNVPRIKRFLSESEGQVVPSFWDMSECGSNDVAKKELNALLERADVFDTPKPVALISRMLTIGTAQIRNDIILDFFAGSGTTGEAVMRLNAEDGGQRQFILVQIPQPIDAKKQQEAHRFVTETLGKPEATIFEITAERLRRAGARIHAEKPDVDTGFRVFDLVDDPDALILQKPLQEATQDDLRTLQQSIATPQPAQLPRILHNLLLAEGLPLSTRMATIQGDVLYRAENTLFILRDADTDDIRPLLNAAQNPVTHLSVYAPWVHDNNFLLGLKTMLESLHLSEDRLRLRG